MKKKLKIIFLSVVLLAFFSETCPAEKETMKFTKQPELQQIRPKKPVRIKLRRTEKDGYTWELNGDDADEIIKTDRKLRKMLKAQ
ncbi:MAG: hypothetical protein A2X59_06640 [Nitrospirae bacterium GWC2_42_7]|nr:MAG: hypothetical protein A2X59_06640 [Nitrospirae bacterium GWC2_42_7]